MLLMMFNVIFKGEINAYPSNWLCFVNGIPKKGLLKPPKFVRFITIYIYITIYYRLLPILNSRLNKFLKIPTEQSTYKKRKGTTFM